MIQAQTIDEISRAVGQTIQVTGVAENAKASAMLNVDANNRIYVQLETGQHWPDALRGQRVTVTGKPFVSKGAIYPAATRDEQGAWSQGIVTPESLRRTGLSDEGSPMTQPPSTTSGELMLAVLSYCQEPEGSRGRQKP